MNNIYISPDQKRQAYERIVSDVAAQMGIGANQFKQQYKVFQSTVLMGAYLESGLSAYSLSPRKGVNPIISTEVKLDQNDFFAVEGMGLRFGRATYSSGNGQYSQHGNYNKFTYPFPSAFNGVPATGLNEYQCLQTILNGTLQVSVTGDTLLDSIACQELVFSQYPGTDDPSFDTNAQTIGGTDGQRGIFPITPQLILDASADNQFQLNLADGDKTVINGSVDDGGDPSAHRNLIWLVLYGWKIKNLSGAGVAACRV